jgi:hypothetical protein
LECSDRSRQMLNPYPVDRYPFAIAWYPLPRSPFIITISAIAIRRYRYRDRHSSSPSPRSPSIIIVFPRMQVML